MSIAAALGMASKSKQAMDLNGLSSLLAMNNKPPTLAEITSDQYAPLEDQRYIGDFNPESMSPTELRNILTDQKSQDAQYASLDQLGEIAEQGGMTAIDRARLEETRGILQAQERGSRDAIAQNMAQRGMSGSGSELAQTLLNSQGSAERASAEGMQTNAAAQQRALEAIMSRGQLGGQMQSADFQRQATRAQAQDSINQFNNQNRNQATAMNLANRQGIQNFNTGQRNQVSQQNTGLRNADRMYNQSTRPQAQYAMASGQMAQTQGALQNQSSAIQQQSQFNAAQNQQLTGALIGAAGSVGGGYAMGLGKAPVKAS